MALSLPTAWRPLLADQHEQPYFRRLERFVEEERGQYTVFPPEEQVFAAPPSARNGFFGSRPFSAINAALRAAGKPEIDWQIPDLLMSA